MNVSPSSKRVFWGAVAALILQLQPSSTSAQATLDSRQSMLVEIGPNELVWRNSSGGRVVTMETGMNYWNGKEWAASDPTFDLTDDAFVANRLQHRVRLAANLNDIGAVTLVTPDGITLHSTPVGIGLYDAASGQSAIIASITNCSGVLVGDNRVVYSGAFAGDGVCADVIYTIERGSFAQDVVFTGRLNPADYGFPTNTTRIQILTEFYQPPEPETVRRPIRVEMDPQARLRMASPDLLDDTLGFGELVLATGRAATLENIDDLAAPAAAVAKQFTAITDVTTRTVRTFLIESVEYGLVSKELEALPECGERVASVRRSTRGKLAELQVPSPGGVLEQATTGYKPTRMKLASSFSPRKGFAIDYLATIGGTLSGTRTFAGDTTYFLTNAVTCSGTAIIESGAVFKFPTNSTSYLKVTGTLTCKTASFRPAIFTAADDDTVGATLSTNIWSGYTGTIRTNGYGNPALWVYYLGSPTLSHLRFRYSQEAIRVEGTDGYSATVAHAQLVNCIRGIVISGAGGSGSSGAGLTVNVYNSLLAGVQKPFNVNVAASVGNFYHGTFHQASYLISSTVGSATGTFHNSVFANVTNLYSGSASAGGDHNGFYSTTAFGTSSYTTTSLPFQIAGAGNYYLAANSNFRDVGVTSGMPATLLAELRRRTTFPPVILSNILCTTPTALSSQASRDTDTLDLGYHYEPIDWAVNTLTVSGTTLTLTNGVSLATFGNDGIWLADGSQFYGAGLPTNHNHLARFFNIQEQPVNWGGGTLANMASINPYNYNFAPPAADIRFTDFDAMADSGYHLYTTLTNWTFSRLLLKDCSLNSAAFYLDGPTNSVLGITNNLLERVNSSFQHAPQIGFYNNLVRYGTNRTYYTGSGSWSFKDNAFDNSGIVDSGNVVSAGYNAYINMGTNRFYPTNAFDKVLGSFTYRTGPLGDYYQFSSNLIDAGSRNATNAGLYHYTVTTNFVNGTQIKETNSIVDIGFHYVALNTNNVPVDTDGDGLPDYLEDTNGNGNDQFLISLVSPLAYANYAEPATIAVQASLTSWSHVITNVEFIRESSIRIADLANNPYVYSWPVVSAGSYSLTAIAHDLSGLSVTSAPVNIAVTNLCSH